MVVFGMLQKVHYQKNKGLSAVSQKDFKPQVRLRIIKLILTYTELLKPKLVFASNLFS